jgi:hypothetical protein
MSSDQRKPACKANARSSKAPATTYGEVFDPQIGFDQHPSLSSNTVQTVRLKWPKCLATTNMGKELEKAVFDGRIEPLWMAVLANFGLASDNWHSCWQRRINPSIQFILNSPAIACWCQFSCHSGLDAVSVCDAVDCPESSHSSHLRVAKI